MYPAIQSKRLFDGICDYCKLIALLLTKTATAFATILQQAAHAEPAAGGDTVSAADAEDAENSLNV